MSVRLRIAITVVVAITLGLTAALMAMNVAYESNLRIEAKAAVLHAEKALDTIQSGDAAVLGAVAGSIAVREDVAQALADEDREHLLDLAGPVLEQVRDEYGVTRLNFIAPDGRVVVRVHDPDRRGDLLSRGTIEKAQETGEPASGLEAGTTAFALRHIRPIKLDGTLVGFVEASREIDEHLTLIREHTGDQYALVLLKSSVDAEAWADMRTRQGLRNNWDDHHDVVVASLADPDEHSSEWTKSLIARIDEGADWGDDLLSVEGEGDAVTALGGFPVKDVRGDKLGVMLVNHDLTPVAKQMRQMQYRVTVAALTTAAVLSVLIIVMVNLLVLKTLDRIRGTMSDTLSRLGVAAPLRSADTTKRVDEFTAFEEQLGYCRDNLEELVENRTADLRHTNLELTRASEAKSRLMANMSHELRTPLNSIIGYTGVVLQGFAGPLTAEQRLQLGFVARSGKQLLALIDDILDLSRIEAGRVSLEVSTFTADELIAEVVADSALHAERRGLALEVGERLLGVELETDHGRLAQVLRNLVDNAVKYTPEGSVTVSAHLVSAGHVRFSVADTGVGIRPEHQERVFRAFTQTEEAGSIRVGGTGLGLSISRLIIRALGGTIYVTSVPDEGATFSFVVPQVLKIDAEESQSDDAAG